MFLQRMSDGGGLSLFEKYIQYELMKFNCKNKHCVKDTQKRVNNIKEDQIVPEVADLPYKKNTILDTDIPIENYSSLSEEEKEKIDEKSKCLLNQFVSKIIENIQKHIEYDTIIKRDKIYKILSKEDDAEIKFDYGRRENVPYVICKIKVKIMEIDNSSIETLNVDKVKKQNDLNSNMKKGTKQTNIDHNNFQLINDEKKTIINIMDYAYRHIVSNDLNKYNNNNGLEWEMKNQQNGDLTIIYNDNEYTIKQEYVKEYFDVLKNIEDQKKNIEDQKKEFEQQINNIKKLRPKIDEVKREIEKIVEGYSILIVSDDTTTKLKAFESLIGSYAKAPNQCNASQPLLRYCELVF